MQRVVIAMSGGVDSAVSALLLKKHGYGVEGVYMSNWDDKDELGQCSSDEDYNNVMEIADAIGITCNRVEFVKEYWTDIFSDFLQDLQNGYTPNPDILCNEKIKFGVFRKHVFSKLGATMLATGHYGRIRKHHNGDTFQLLKSIDSFKDQTFFLSTIPQASLHQTLFPIGHLIKSQVRQIALEAGLNKTLKRKESMGLCFIGKRRFQSFLHEYINDRQGLFVSHDGHVMGEHKGHHYYTIGQRARLGGLERPWFVSGKDPIKNLVTIVEGSDHPLLYSDRFMTGPAHWIRAGMRNGEEKLVEARYRHQQRLFSCCVRSNENGLVVTATGQKLRAVTPGQYVVFYNDEECLGGARIERVCNHGNSNTKHETHDWSHS